MVAWALDARKTGPMSPEARLVLVTLAEYAHDDGSNTFPSAARIGARLAISERSVRRNLATLLDAGIIRRGDQQLVAHYRPDRRPVVYALVLDTTSRGDSGDTPQPPRPDAAVTPPEPPRGDSNGRHGVTATSPNPRTKPTTPPLPPNGTHPQTTAARAANGQRADGAHIACGFVHPAGLSCPTGSPMPPEFRALALGSPCPACGITTRAGPGELCERCHTAGVSTSALPISYEDTG